MLETKCDRTLKLRGTLGYLVRREYCIQLIKQVVVDKESWWTAKSSTIGHVYVAKNPSE